MRLALSTPVLPVVTVLALLGLSQSPAMAQLSYKLETESAPPIELSGKDQTRPDNGIILFTRDFGDSTRTNRYGVEIIAEKAGSWREENRYKVTKITSVWECDANPALTCGNASIPRNGIVLSATGDARKKLLETLAPGKTFTLAPQWFQQKTTAISVVNPTPENNPNGSAFPGYRAGQQMIVYDTGYGKPTTGTNEFGYEVTVVDGIVVRQEGSNSTIPPENGYVLSGHGRSRDWLIANAPIGARIQLSEDKKAITSIIDLSSYTYQLTQRMKEADTLVSDHERREVERAQQRIERLRNEGKLAEATQLAVSTLEHLNRDLWKAYPAFPTTAIRASWTRPVETSRAEIGHTLDLLKESGINAVFLETFFHGFTIFPSETMKAYGIAVQNPKFTQLDLLQAWVDEAHKRGMKLHVWFQDFYVGTKAFQAPGPILSKYPQWANVQYSAIGQSGPTASTLETGGYFMDPANPEVRDFLVKLIEEIVTRYDVDGFQFDYIRYPASFPPDRFSYLKTTWGYTPAAREAFQQQYGADPLFLTPDDAEMWANWGRFKAEQITGFVQRASARIREKAPKVQISAAVFPRYAESYGLKHQDWPLWADQGWVDFLAPMTLTSAVKVVEEDLQRVVERTGGKVPVIAGLFGPFNQNTAENLLEQINAAQKSGSAGYAIFDTAHLTGRMLQALEASQVQTASAEKKKDDAP